MSREFSAQSYLDDWRKHGKFPEIHDDIYSLILEEHAKGDRYLDLCGSTGLLAQRLHQSVAYERVFGIDADDSAVKRGKKAGIEPDFVEMRIVPSTLPMLASLLISNGTTAISARRCMPELFVQGHPFINAFKATLSPHVRTIYLEGRARRSTATHPFPNLDAEIAALAPEYVPERIVGECAKMIRAG